MDLVESLDYLRVASCSWSMKVLACAKVRKEVFSRSHSLLAMGALSSTTDAQLVSQDIARLMIIDRHGLRFTCCWHPSGERSCTSGTGSLSCNDVLPVN